MASTTPPPTRRESNATAPDVPISRSSVVSGTGNGLSLSPPIYGSDSSDDGLRMTPAEARRFARRNLRRASATPDLVTSLVRPPSPEAFYITPEIHGRMRQGGVLRGLRRRTSGSMPGGGATTAGGGSASTINTDRRSGPLLPPHKSSLDIPKRYGGQCIFDMYSLSYVAEPDTNLLCPICHDPLVDPVTTPCDHTFCYRCIRRSISSSPSGTACPIDREPLFWADCFSAARLIRTQLNALVVKCPYTNRGCTKELRREMIEKHASSECRYRDYYCPDKDCTKKLSSKPTDDLCHHKETSCAACLERVEEADSELHLLSCLKSKTRCEACWDLVVRSQMDAHRDLECDGVEVGCPYQNLGCPARIMRGQVSTHTLCCAFHPETPSGIIIRSQRDVIQSYGDMASQLRDLQARQAENTRRLDDMSVSGRRFGVGGSSGSGAGAASSSGAGAGEPAISDSCRTMQDLDAGFEEVHQNLTHLEARQSMWTLNQVMPIREEVTELRNNINMIRMHVNWLLNRSREEGRIRAANNTGAAAAAAAAAAGVRRNSAGEGVMLQERRRSSGMDADVPRL
ncbi:Zinc finger, RING/FYVE/PHD-type [Cordyceps fumosorosea ARSEF 2679]|uniref:Zinc finger, RING/FYVE/PHD-type n=1 Tax=Cordyceps fumosorosea (strain ARSEF 2679) TaxID=1081104 RepID=A0A167LAX5_CORFA|nr:Zinc finger, RING/FYVE/PHD-type [Cordyceps fumosorosea ARSEF 2679]OAA52862.1 Zinc finger, RING/FYVE/PHD-type [Cordyceps fumosorosea ARSEF 2679]